MAPADRLLDVLNGWLSTTASPGAPTVARLSVETTPGAALFAKLSEAQAERVGHLLAADDAALRAHRASVNGGGSDGR